MVNPADPDLWHRLALGETLWQTHQFPLGGTFSYLADYRHIADHEWGSALIFYGLYQWSGGVAMVMLKLILLALTLTLLVWAGLTGRRPTAFFATFYAVVLLALLPSFQWTVRCMTFTHFFFALWLYWYQCERHGRRIAPLAYILTAILWANLHGGFVIGLAWLLGVTVVEFWQGGAWKRWGALLSSCTLVTLINPFGWQLWISTGRALLTTRRGLDEWSPVSWSDMVAYPGYKILLVGAVITLGLLIYTRGWRRVDRSSILLIGAAMALSLTSARYTTLFAAVCAALGPDLLPNEPAIQSFENPIHRLGYLGMRFMMLLVPLYAALSILPGSGLDLQFTARFCPVQAVDYLEGQNVHGRLLVPLNYGSYALWRLRGRMRVSMDGRYDLVYRPETYQKVDDFFSARGEWNTLLHSPAPDAILLPVNDAVYPKLKALEGWTEAWHSATDAVFLPR